MTVLDEIITEVREDLAVRQADQPPERLLELVREAQPARPMVPALRAPGLVVVVEAKRRPPSKGDLAEITDPAALATNYAAGGVVVISMLTEKRCFSGSLTDLDAVRKAVGTPLPHKDFMVHSYQFYGVRVHGADLVLLIAATLSDVGLRAFSDLTDALGMTALVEVHTEEEVEQAVNAGVEVIGINNQDLKTLEMDFNRSGKFVLLIPDDRVKVAGFGILSIDDARRARQEGVDAIFAGEVLVRYGGPHAAIEESASID